jgi:hypothetical protein
MVAAEEGSKRRLQQLGPFSHGSGAGAYYRATGDERILRALVKAYKDYPLPALKRDFFYPVGGACNIDPMLHTYLLSGEKNILHQIAGKTENTLDIVEGGSRKLDWAQPGEGVIASMRNIRTVKNKALRFRVNVEPAQRQLIAIGLCDGWHDEPGSACKS